MKVRAQERYAHACNGHPELSAAAQHALDVHQMDWTPEGIVRATSTMERKVKEAITIHQVKKRTAKECWTETDASN